MKHIPPFVMEIVQDESLAVIETDVEGPSLPSDAISLYGKGWPLRLNDVELFERVFSPVGFQVRILGDQVFVVIDVPIGNFGRSSLHTVDSNHPLRVEIHHGNDIDRMRVMIILQGTEIQHPSVQKRLYESPRLPSPFVESE